MDCAKGINFLLTNGGTIADYWGVGKATRAMLPMIAIPTTAGTGSEAQSFALIADERTHQKMACGDRKAMPAAAILDPELTVSQPAHVTADTGIDAISHALETWVTNRRNAVSTLFSQEAWRLLSANFRPRARQPGRSRSPRRHATRRLLRRNRNREFHARRGPFLRQSPHGALQRRAWRRRGHHAAGRDSLQCDLRWAASTDELAGSRDGAETLACRVESLLQRAALPTRLSQYSIPQDVLPELAREASRQWTAQFNPRPVDENDLLEIYRCVY